MEKPMEIRKNSLLEKLENYGKSDFYPFHMPGHKRQDFLNGFPDPYSIDITEIDGFDNLHHAEGILKESMERAAEIYGADQTCYLVNGSTCGILSAVCGSTAWGGKLLMARNCHKSAYHGLILNHLEPVYVYPSYLEGPGISGGVCPSDVRRILEQDKKREIQAVLVVSPTYEGVVSDIAGIAAAAHEHGIPLIVDEAHGAHLPFGERENGFPEPALSMGADVVIQSLHKTLPCFTQTAVLHMKGDLADRERICRYLGMFQSSSPSYVFMAAMEQCIRFMDGDGRREMAAYGKRLERFFQQVKDLRNLKVLDWEKIVEADHSRKAGAAPGTISVYGWDPSKIVISCKRVWFKNVSGERQRLSGEALGNILRERYHLEMEMCAPEYVIGMTSVMDTEEGLLRLEKALWELDQVWTQSRKAFPAERGKAMETEGFLSFHSRLCGFLRRRPWKCPGSGKDCQKALAACHGNLSICILRGSRSWLRERRSQRTFWSGQPGMKLWGCLSRAWRTHPFPT